jgi:hypothetical protein
MLINAATVSRTTSLPPVDIRRVMSKSSKRMTNLTYTEYRASYHKSACNQSFSLIDRGANVGVAGTDVRVNFKTGRMVDIRGIYNHQCTNIDIGTVGGVVHTQMRYVIAIMYQYALLNKGSTIQSPCQVEWYKNDVHEIKDLFMFQDASNLFKHLMVISSHSILRLEFHVFRSALIQTRNGIPFKLSSSHKN